MVVTSQLSKVPQFMSSKVVKTNRQFLFDSNHTSSFENYFFFLKSLAVLEMELCKSSILFLLDPV